MGRGIAQVCALSGSEVMVFDSSKENLKSAGAKIEATLQKGVDKGVFTSDTKKDASDRINFVDSAEKLKGDLIIEAVFESLTIKQNLFKILEKVNSQETILATNTSSIPITQIAASLKRPENFIGIHFFNPAHIMKLVEVIKGVSTSEDVTKLVVEWVEKVGKVPVLANDSPGFIVNRVARHFYTESLKAVEENAADFRVVDDLMESAGFKMGPFRLMDLIGVDTNYSVTSSMFEQFNYESRFRPSRLQRKYVDAGWHGKKTGKGFYDYD